MNRHLLATLVASTIFGPALAFAQTTLFVLDGSGSMWGKVEGRPKIEIAREVMGDLAKRLPPDARVGLMVYGHNRKDDCSDIEIVSPLGSDRAVFVQALNDINPKGKTPITASLHKAVEQLRQDEGSASIVIVSDGKETCGGDPCAAARDAISTGVHLRIHVIGFDVAPDETQQLTCIAEEGHGKYFAASNAEQLVTALADVEKEVVAPPPPPPPPAQSQPAAQVLFEDHFEREELGDEYQVLDPDPDRFALMDGKVLIVGSPQLQNVALLKQDISGNFVATIKVQVQLMQNNWAGLFYWIDPENKLTVSAWGHCCPDGRWLSFSKTLKGKNNDIYDGPTGTNKVGERLLDGYATEPEVWYLQLERSGVKYTARSSTDGTAWKDIGTHTVLQKGGRLGFGASAGGGIENAAEFDDFVVTGAK